MAVHQRRVKQAVQEPRTAGFKVDWTGLGHTAIEIMASDEQLVDKYKDDKVLGALPIILNNSELLMQAFAYDEAVATNDRLLTWITKWENYFEASDSAKTSAQAKCPAYSKHKIEQLDPFTKHVFAGSQVVENSTPKLLESCSKPWLFGLTPSYVYGGIDPEGFGTLRVFVGGALEVLCVSGVDAEKIAEEFKGKASRGEN